MADELEDLIKRSKDSEAMVPYWNKTDAIVEGYEVIKLAGKEYLPQFSEEPESDFKTRLEISKFTNIYRDVLEGLASKPFEEEISLISGESKKIPVEIEDFCEDVDGSGNNLTIFSATTFFNGLNSAISWIFVDYPTVDASVIRTVADLKNAGIRPFWSHVLGRNVLEARTKIISGKETLSYIKIFEPASNGDVNHIRVFELLLNGEVIWKLYRHVPESTKKDTYVLETEGKLSIDVIPLVPFITGRRDGKTFKLFPAMQDAADLQITLYQDESALQFIKTMAGYPMLAANGMKPQLDANGIPKKIAIGPSKILYGTPDAAGNHGTWTYVEPSANSMKFLQENIDKTKQDLRELGRQPLTAQSGQLTVITTAVAAGKAKTAVAAWTYALKDALENALVITSKWLNLKDYEPEVNVYNEFDNFTDNNADLTALKDARTNGDLSQETYWSELKRRKVLSPEFEADEEKKKILGEIPTDNSDLENEDDDSDSKDIVISVKKPKDQKNETSTTPARKK